MIWMGFPGIECKKRNDKTVIVSNTATKRSARCAMNLATVLGLSSRRYAALHARSQPARGVSQEARVGPQRPSSHHLRRFSWST
jgi:hypothetical protein